MNHLYKICIGLIFITCYSCSAPSDKSNPAVYKKVDMSSFNIVEVTARDFLFDVQDKIPCGWTAFHFNNDGHTEHFFVLHKLPDNKTIEDYKDDVAKPFDVVLDSINSGMTKGKASQLLGQKVASWFLNDVDQMGGSGITSNGNDSYTITKLEAGNYIMECYIKESGTFHSELGMLRSLTVTNDTSQMDPPAADFNIILTNSKIDTSGKLVCGENIIEVRFQEQPELGLGNDIHLFKIENDKDIDDAKKWIDWMNIEGLQTPSPVKFLGGSQEMPEGNKAYFIADLAPGKYGLISESGNIEGNTLTLKVD